jgi:AraC-like DNA-binding protein
MDGLPSSIMLKRGDCVILPRGAAYSLTSASGPELADGNPESGKDGLGCFLVGGEFLLMSHHADAMFRCLLPPLIYRRKGVNQDALMKTLSYLLEELKRPRPSGDLMVKHLATRMLIHVLRDHIAEAALGSVGWWFALADETMAIALTRMHESPAHCWSLRELALQAGLSRSTFAKRFKDTVGVTPMEYLTRWRMILAGARLHWSEEPISRIASAFGYRSEEAFGRVFRSVMGASPARYRRDTW